MSPEMVQQAASFSSYWPDTSPSPGTVFQKTPRTLMGHLVISHLDHKEPHRDSWTWSLGLSGWGAINTVVTGESRNHQLQSSTLWERLRSLGTRSHQGRNHCCSLSCGSRWQRDLPTWLLTSSWARGFPWLAQIPDTSKQHHESRAILVLSRSRESSRSWGGVAPSQLLL